MDDCELIGLASEALAQAYAPYSGFRVGACVVTPEGEAFSACNV